MKPPLRLRGKLPYARPDPHGWMHDAIIELVEDTPITVTAGTVLTLAVREDLRTHPRSAEVTIEFIECHHTRAPRWAFRVSPASTDDGPPPEPAPS